jgi:hypothetical protein
MFQTLRIPRAGLVALFVVALTSPALAAKPDQPAHPAPGNGGKPTPNILLIVLDDVGIDQMETFGYGGSTPPSTPSITAIADSGIRFQNAWSMPACTTTRGVMYSARFPFRTNLLGALGPDDLANSMMSPYETTTPKLLRTRGYQSALFGKSHLSLQGHDPAGLGGPHAIGFDYFAGWLDETGDPTSIDTTAGGVATGEKVYPCGYVPSAAAGGADSGACYQSDGSCTVLTTTDSVPPGRVCRDGGGILDPNQTCKAEVPDYVDFTLLSGHYVSPLVLNHPDGQVDEVPKTDPRARTFRGAFVVEEAARWINSRPDGTPWMAAVSFASDHTPLMQPPFDAAVPGNRESSDANCLDPSLQQSLSNMLIDDMDDRIADLLEGIGLATRDNDGKLAYRPDRTDTMVIVLGDNGSLAATVKPPFDFLRSKGTAYQTGVWVPLVVAGPLMRGPVRTVPHMVNVADLYALFAEIAGIDNFKSATRRPIDAERMLPYVTNPQQRSLRKVNFTQVGVNLQAGGSINGPCTIGGTCTQIPVTKGVCEDNGGIWWGKNHDDPLLEGAPEDGFALCCEVNDFVVQRGCPAGESGCPYNITPLVSLGIRNDRFKVVQNNVNVYVSHDEPCRNVTTTEFFEIDEAVPTPKIDTAENAIPLDSLDRVQKKNFTRLSRQLARILASEPACPGDGTLDLVVDQADLDGWAKYEGGSSVFDFNLDGNTDEADRQVIEDNLGTHCAPR